MKPWTAIVSSISIDCKLSLALCLCFISILCLMITRLEEEVQNMETPPLGMTLLGLRLAKKAKYSDLDNNFSSSIAQSSFFSIPVGDDDLSTSFRAQPSASFSGSGCSSSSAPSTCSHSFTMDMCTKCGIEALPPTLVNCCNCDVAIDVAFHYCPHCRGKQ